MAVGQIQRVRLEEITDGTSATAAFSERTLGPGGSPAGAADQRRVMRQIPGEADRIDALHRILARNEGPPN